MAGDWIPYCKDLPRKPEVLRIAELTGMDRRVVVATLLDFWGWADEQSVDGVFPELTLRNLSALNADICPQFFLAMSAVGWLRCGDVPPVVIPDFAAWMGRSAKRRLKEAKRKADGRQSPPKRPSRPHSVRDLSACDADTLRPTEQNRTEQEFPLTIPPELDTDEFRRAFAEWTAFRRERRLRRYNPRGLTALYAKLAKMGPQRAVAAIAHSIAQNYHGIYEPKGAAPPAPRGNAKDDYLFPDERPKT